MLFYFFKLVTTDIKILKQKNVNFILPSLTCVEELKVLKKLF